MRWHVSLLAMFLFLALPALAVDQWGCCVPPFGSCFDGSAFDSQGAFEAACTSAGDSQHDAYVTGAGSLATCSTVSQCTVGCCCAGPDVFDAPTINNDESLLRITRAACDVKDGFSYLPAASSCVAACGGSSPQPGNTGTFTVSGTVVNSSDGEPLPGADVFMYAGEISGTTGADGTFTLTDVPRINARVFAVHDACQPGQSAPLLIDRDIEDVEIALDCFLDACPHAAPAFVEQPHVKRGTPDVEFTLSLPDVCGDFIQYEPYWCDAAFENCVALPPETTDVVTHHGVDPHATYCYTVRARFSDGTVTQMESGACVTAGDAACMSGDVRTQWCGLSGDLALPAILQCDESNQLIPTVCEADTVCSERSGSPACVPVPSCDQCNGLLGLFARLLGSLEIPNGIFTTTCDAACTLDSEISGKPLSVDAYASCLGINDCTAYRSEHACVDDTCNLASCSWSTVNDELGQGICTAPDAPACGSCDDLFGYCTKAMCETISPDCYYDGNGNGLSSAQGCIAKQEMACRYYDTQQDCTGSAANAVFGIRYTDGERSGGDHRLTTRSQDRFSFGVCSWSADRCIKDADMQNNGEDDCIENGRIFSDPDCVQDMTPPETTFFVSDPPVYSRPAIRTLPFRAVDDTTPAAEIATLVCFGTGCYPMDTLSTIELPEEGDHTLRYYSMDANGNSEVVKEARIVVRDTGEPAVENVEIEENS